ncbi:PREDICTED: protein NRT1/ PTR FAMILY 1.2-like [Erythranthe guttata]|uniref:protein NRT1/ PTR FAMILY 1.2-like n=1 Tax=Erythranthe guttata TaxID=4155 RepID=UPI00064D81A9|nr:PREDICTED: protein NRT1/ PTR FAMILY 1.2-like [Erythranthe guttata]|eukprot:XP_012846427.1 PREDICTED: protein NRT1/ PTR FAMILY 1.2-like [Erythranthe guttata]
MYVVKGLVLLWLTAVIEKSRSPKCDIKESGICHNTKPVQMILLFVAFVLMSIGAGGIRPCSMAFGADQFDNPENPNSVRIMESFFNWYYASLGVSLMIALTVIVYIQNEFGWVIGFGVPVGLMLLSAVMFFIGSKLYVNVKPNKSLLTGLVQVWVAYWNKRHLPFPPDDNDDSAHYYYNNDHSKLFVPTQKLRLLFISHVFISRTYYSICLSSAKINSVRYLNKACMLINPEKEVKADGSPSDTWSLCSVMQVQVLKSLIQLLPIWSTGIMIGVTISQHSFPVLQANTLNRRLAGNFKIPAGSFGIFAILTLTIWVILYDRVIVPLLSKHTNNPRGIKVITRIGIGIFISCMATATAALVERARRAKAIHQGLEETPNAEVFM